MDRPTRKGRIMGTIHEEQRGTVLIGTFDNPPHGLIDRGSVVALEQLVERAENDDRIDAVVLTGSHPERFVAHYDVGEILSGVTASPAVGAGVARASLRAVAAARRMGTPERALRRTPLAGLLELERFHQVFLRMNRCGAVFVAAINGSAQGGGCELALACDQRLMAAGEHGIGQPEIFLAFPPGGGGTQRLARLLGSARALKLVLDGAPISPDEAADIGLVDRVVPSGELLDESIELARHLGARPKAAIAAAKRAIYEGGSLPLVDGLRLEASEFLSTAAAPESIRAMEAYVDQLERTGELPLYDPETIERVSERGHFE
jgi:enoyl-CoA hydratase/carnithine racemase